jgi:hypothetical protein
MVSPVFILSVKASMFLFLHGLSDVFDHLADLSFGFPEGVLGLPGSFVGHTFVMEIRIVCEIARHLLDFASHHFSLAFELIAIHGCSSRHPVER